MEAGPDRHDGGLSSVAGSLDKIVNMAVSIQPLGNLHITSKPPGAFPAIALLAHRVHAPQDHTLLGEHHLFSSSGVVDQGMKPLEQLLQPWAERALGGDAFANEKSQISFTSPMWKALPAGA